MAQKLTKKQAEALLAAYTKAQTAATDQAIAAAAAKQDETVRQATADKQAAVEQAREEAKRSYDAQTVQRLADERMIAERVANLGLFGSGQHKALADGARRVWERGAAENKDRQRQAFAAAETKLATVKATVAAEKKKTAADAKKTLAGKIAEKRLSLDRAVIR